MSPRVITAVSGLALILSGIFVAVFGLPHALSAGLLSIGLFGLHYRQASAGGILSLAGSAVVLLGFLLLVNRPLMEALLGELPADTQTLAVILIPGFIITNGVVVFGISVIRAQIFPWRNGVLLILSVLLVLVLGSLGAILFGISLSWLGYLQLTGRDITGERLGFDE